MGRHPSGGLLIRNVGRHSPGGHLPGRPTHVPTDPAPTETMRLARVARPHRFHPVDIPNCRIHEWRNGKELKGRLGRGRILWIKARTLSGKTINIVNVYQATVDKPEMQKRMYETLTRTLNAEHDPCILVGELCPDHVIEHHHHDRCSTR